MKYRLKFNTLGRPAGTVVKRYKGHDYGLASQDSFYLGVEHIAVQSLEEEDKFFTVAIDDLETIND